MTKVKVSKTVHDAMLCALEQTNPESLLLVHAAMVTGMTDKRWSSEVEVLNGITLWELACILTRGFEVMGEAGEAHES